MDEKTLPVVRVCQNEIMDEKMQPIGGCVKIGASSFYTSLKTVMSEYLYSVAAFLFFDRVTPKCPLRVV